VDLDRVAGIPGVSRRGLDAGALPELPACKAIDFGGCRCCAFALAGDATSTDPVCRLSPHHVIVEEALNEAVGPSSIAIGTS
jgi:hypothetical protein